MITRRHALLLLAGAACGTRIARAQPATRVPVVGILATGGEGTDPLHAFEQGLRSLGYVDSKNIRIERRLAGGQRDRLPGLAAQLVRFPVDVIVAVDPPATIAAKNATATIPIVMRSSDDPVANGLVVSLGRPGGNITGLYSLYSELPPKRLELLRETIPALTLVAVLWSSKEPGSVIAWEKTVTAARALQIPLHSLDVQRLDQLDAVFHEALRVHAQALITLRNPLIVAERGRILELAAKSRLPVIYDDRTFVEEGGLMSYGANLADLYRRAAGYVDKILKGAKPGYLPVEQPETFELLINLNTARALGITIPQSLLLRADEVIR